MDGTYDFLTPADHELLASRAERRQYSRHQPIVEEGSTDQALYRLLEGAARVERSQVGRGVSLARLGPGDSFGETSLLEDIPSTAWVIADEEQVEVEVIERRVLEPLLAADHGFGARFYKSLAIILARRVRELVTHGPEFAVEQGPQAERIRTSRSSHDGTSAIPRALRTAVEQFKAELLTAERSLENGERDDADVQGIVNAACDALVDVLQAHVREVGQLDPQVGAYVFREAFPFMMRSRIIDRWVTKPRGYAGDFLTIELMYRNEPCGDGQLGRLVDRWALGGVPTQAVRNRRALLTSAIREVAAHHRDTGPALVTSLASGPAREVFDVLSEPDAPDLRVTCVDIDPEALVHAAGVAQTLGVTDRVSFAQDNVIHLSQGRGRTALGPQHLIYSIGLTDYLEDKYVVALLNWIHDQLAPGGVTVIGNFDVSNPNRAFMDHFLEWRLIHRTAADLRRLFSLSKFGATPVEVRAEETGINLFAFCTKRMSSGRPSRQSGAFAVLSG